MPTSYFSGSEQHVYLYDILIKWSSNAFDVILLSSLKISKQFINQGLLKISTEIFHIYCLFTALNYIFTFLDLSCPYKACNITCEHRDKCAVRLMFQCICPIFSWFNFTSYNMFRQYITIYTSLKIFFEYLL